jgi:hypothetical protein
MLSARRSDTNSWRRSPTASSPPSGAPPETVGMRRAAAPGARSAQSPPRRPSAAHHPAISPDLRVRGVRREPNHSRSPQRGAADAVSETTTARAHFCATSACDISPAIALRPHFAWQPARRQWVEGVKSQSESHHQHHSLSWRWLSRLALSMPARDVPTPPRGFGADSSSLTSYRTMAGLRMAHPYAALVLAPRGR